MFHSVLFQACLMVVNAALLVSNALLCRKAARIMKRAREHLEATYALTPWINYDRNMSEGADP